MRKFKILKFEDLISSRLKEIYHFENNFFCIFKVLPEDKNLVSRLTHLASEKIEKGFIFKTSGTTSAEKFVLHSFESLKLMARVSNDFFNLTDRDQFLNCLSPYHMGGFSVLFRSLMSSSGFSELQDWSPEKFVEFANEKKSTITSMVPSQIFDLVQKKIRAPKSLRIVLVGASALESKTHQKALDLGWPIYKTFGSTETASQLFTQEHPGLEPAVLLSHWNLKVDKGQNLFLKGESLFLGYIEVNKEKLSYLPIGLDNAGYFKSEDKLVVKEKRLIEFLGRENDFIKINSSLINLKKINDEFKNLLFKIDPALPNSVLITAVKDVKAGFLLNLFLEINVVKYFKVIERILFVWNQKHSAAESIRGFYMIKNFSRSELGKIKKDSLNLFI